MESKYWESKGDQRRAQLAQEICDREIAQGHAPAPVPQNQKRGRECSVENHWFDNAMSSEFPVFSGIANSRNGGFLQSRSGVVVWSGLETTTPDLFFYFSSADSDGSVPSVRGCFAAETKTARSGTLRADHFFDYPSPKQQTRLPAHALGGGPQFFKSAVLDLADALLADAQQVADLS
jgi:hypothetical protein